MSTSQMAWGGVIFDGSFQYLRRHTDSVYGAEGAFDKNQKLGDWTFYSKTPQASCKLNTYFLNGVIYGDLYLAIEHKTDGYTEDLSMTVINGEINGRFTGHFDKGYFTGICDDNGYPDGTWTLAIKDGRKTTLTKKEIWVHGVLKEAYEEGADKKRSPMEPCLRDRINLILMNDVSQLLNIIPQGTQDDVLHVHRK